MRLPPTAYTLLYPAGVDLRVGPPLVSTDNALTVEGIELGKKLFFDTRLSKDGTISCASCHGQSHAFDDSTKFSKGVGGSLGDRNAMPVINLAWNRNFFWDGRRTSLETQAHDPVSNPVEMAAKWPVVVATLQRDSAYNSMFFKAFGTHAVDSILVVKAIAQFERTLISFNTRYDAFYFRSEGVLTDDEVQGYELFSNSGCTSCHTDGLLTDNKMHNNGLDIHPVDSGLARVTHNAADYGKFKTPTLRNIALTAPYMHDGRFATLKEVLNFYATGVHFDSPNIDSNMHVLTLTGRQKDQIIAFLNTMTDSSFITNMNFMNH